MRTTVIIPNYNGGRFIGRCLDSLATQRVKPGRVIVVDNGSDDDSRDLARRHPLSPELIELPANRGFAFAVNRGIEACGTEAVALLNNDAEADPGWIEAMEKAMDEHPLVSMFASLMLDAKDRDKVDSAGDLYLRDGRPRPRGRGRRADGFADKAEVMSACAGAGFFRRRLFNEVGLFEVSFVSYLEDVDFGLRARAMGHVCLFVPGARVYHAGAATDLGDRPAGKRVDSSERVRMIAANRVRVMARNWPARFMLRWSFFIAAGLARSAAYHVLVSRQAGPFFSGLVNGLSCLSGDRLFFRERKGKTSFRETALLMQEGSRPWR